MAVIRIIVEAVVHAKIGEMFIAIETFFLVQSLEFTHCIARIRHSNVVDVQDLMQFKRLVLPHLDVCAVLRSFQDHLQTSFGVLADLNVCLREVILDVECLTIDRYYLIIGFDVGTVVQFLFFGIVVVEGF